MEIEIAVAPPSINSMYAHFRGRRITSKKGREFKSYVQSWLKALIYEGKIKPYSDERLKAEYEFHFKGKRKRDLDNYIKSVQDCLSEILFDDDEQIDELTAKRFYHCDYDKIIIKLTQL